MVQIISIHLMLMLIIIHIRVQQHLNNFNTSHVNVNQLYMKIYDTFDIYFNTSHVNVNPCVRIATNADILISIHLMLMLIG